ncbi:uncharacterized protein LY89DRAFT_317150 [Mollisia scopiformis]|uniref:Chromo domain-containing protein n=1 Tax=Mollisia scopiformis TaxID=149040 RepID=A0A132B9C1_MOLSC|nr:uncharacterized protein LY89DRAFT_317150 [Mollisia scopiformis]KUJ08996.1 hypothetical protein LY89DRAFT_317150 [Mollisia scopiformis]
MTERTAAKQAQMEDDAVSLTSTQESEYDPMKEFIVTRILAEKLQGSKRLFLIEWTGYPLERATWEPKDHISPGILDAWGLRKKREKRGISPPFDLVEWQATQNLIAKEREHRKKLRTVRRRSLGMAVPLSDSDANMADKDDSSDAEAMEDNEVEDVPATATATSSTNRKAESPRKPTKKPMRFLVRGSEIQQLDDNSPGDSDAESPRTNVQLKVRDNTTVASSRSEVERSKAPKQVKASAKSETLSSSSSDEPLMLKKRQKMPSPQLSTPGQPISELPALAQPHSGPTDVRESSMGSSNSRQPTPGRPQLVRSSSEQSSKNQFNQERPNSSSSNSLMSGVTPDSELSQLFMDDSPTQTEKRPRGRPRKRGNIATRGGATIVRRNVFESGTGTKATRGRKPGTNLLRVATDSRDPKMAQNMHLRRKLELQAREIAESAPDLSAIGGLFNPSDMSSVQPVRPATLRKSSSSLPTTKDQTDRGVDADLDDLFEEKSVTPLSTIRPPSTLSRQSTRPVCYFWDKAQKDSKSKGCSNGYLCEYHHEYRPGAIVAPPPLGFIEFSNKPSEDPVHYQSVCFFWDRAQTDSRWPTCDKGSSCTYLHEYKIGAPVAQPPPNYVFKSDNTSNAAAQKQSETMDDDFVASPPHPPWNKNALAAQSSNRSAQFARQREQQSQNSFNSTVTYSSALPILPPRQAASTTASEAISTLMSTPLLPSVAKPVARLEERPLWDPLNPENAICHFYYQNGKCMKGDKCKYYHSNDTRLPVIPSLDEQRRIQARITCKNWLNNNCHFTSTECWYLHEHTSTMPPKPDVRKPDAREAVVLPEKKSSALPPPSDSRKKSVKFVLEEEDKVFSEPEPISPAKGAREVNSSHRSRASNETVCTYWLSGNCRYGFNCFNLHENRSRQYSDVEMRDRDDGFQDRSRRTESLKGYIHSSKTPPTPIDQDMSGMDAEDPFSTPLAPVVNSTTIPVASVVSNQGTSIEENPTPVLAPKVPRKKVSVAEYGRNQKLKKIGSRAKLVFFGYDESQPVNLDFGDMQHIEDSPWKRLFTDLDRVTFSQMCIAKDFKTMQEYLKRRGILAGSLVATDAEDQQIQKTIEKIGEELVVRSAGLIASFSGFSILLFPASREEWRFLEASSNYPKEGRLKYFVFESNLPIDRPESSESKGMKLGEPYRRLMIKMIHGLDIKELLPRVEAGQNPWKFYLLFPSTLKHTSTFLARWIKDCSAQSKIYDGQTEGSWDYFRNTHDVGVVLVHESVVANIHCLPHLFEVVSRKPFVFWCISDRDTPLPLFPSWQYEPDDSSLGRITATRLFPHGCAMLLTPSFLVAEPKRAYDFLKLFLNKSENSTPGSYKLVCAFNISQYILDLAISKASEKDAFEIEHRDNPAKDAMLNDAGLSFAHCDPRNKLHTLFARQDAKGWLESPSDSDYSDSEYNFHEDSVSPFVLVDRYIDPDDEPAMIEWFAGWSMRNLDMFRKFVVIGTGPSSARRAQRMKEFVVPVNAEVSQLELELESRVEFNDTAALSEPLNNLPESNFRPFSLSKKENLVPGQSKKSSEAKKTALNVAAKLTALSPYKTPLTTSSPAQTNSTNLTNPPIHQDQVGESTRHGIDTSLPTSQLEFCAATGGSASEAAIYLDRAQHNVNKAIYLYQQEKGGSLDLDSQISQLIATETNKPGPLRIATAEEDLARARELYRSTTSFNPNVMAFSAPESAGIPQYDGSGDARSPESNGADDRPSSSGSTSTTNSGIATGENGRRFVPKSTRADKSVRKEIAVRPGYVPAEDIPRYVSPAVAANRAASRTASLRSSPAPANNSPARAVQDPAVQEPERMDLDSGVDAGSASGEETRMGQGWGGDVGKKKVAVKKEIRKYTFEETTGWYERYKEKNGGGWEHIFVAAHEEAIKKSGVVSAAPPSNK